MSKNTTSIELSLREAMELQKINEEYSNIKSIDNIDRLFTEGMYTLELCYNNFCKSVSLAEMKYYVKNGELLSEATGADAKSIKDKIIEGFKKWVDKAIDFLTRLYRAARLKLIEIFEGKKSFLDKYGSILEKAKGTVTLDKGYEFKDSFDINFIGEKDIESLLTKAIKDDEISFNYMENMILSLVCYGDTNHIKPDNIDANTFMHKAVYGEEKTNIKVPVSAAYNYTRNFSTTLKEYDKIYLEMKKYSDYAQESIKSKYEASKKAYDTMDSNDPKEKLIAKQATDFLNTMMAAYKIVIEYNNKLMDMIFKYMHYRLRQADAVMHLYISDYYTQNKNESAMAIETAVKDNFSGLSIEDIFARVSTL